MAGEGGQGESSPRFTNLHGNLEAVFARANDGVQTCKALHLLLQQTAVVEESYGVAIVKVNPNGVSNLLLPERHRSWTSQPLGLWLILERSEKDLLGSMSPMRQASRKPSRWSVPRSRGSAGTWQLTPRGSQVWGWALCHNSLSPSASPSLVLEQAAQWPGDEHHAGTLGPWLPSMDSPQSQPPS